MTEETIIKIIKNRGTFQINPLSYTSDKYKKILKSMVSRGIVSRQKTSIRLHNYILSEKQK